MSWNQSWRSVSVLAILSLMMFYDVFFVFNVFILFCKSFSYTPYAWPDFSGSSLNSKNTAQNLVFNNFKFSIGDHFRVPYAIRKHLTSARGSIKTKSFLSFLILLFGPSSPSLRNAAQKKPLTGFPVRGFLLHRAGLTSGRGALRYYISTVSATSVKAGIWSKFM